MRSKYVITLGKNYLWIHLCQFGHSNEFGSTKFDVKVFKSFLDFEYFFDGNTVIYNLCSILLLDLNEFQVVIILNYLLKDHNHVKEFFSRPFK